jgi:hypothetical protein
MMYRFPILLDASTAALQRKGDKFFTKWVEIMTGNLLLTVIQYNILASEVDWSYRH